MSSGPPVTPGPYTLHTHINEPRRFDNMSTTDPDYGWSEEDYRTHDLNTELLGYSADCGREVR